MTQREKGFPEMTESEVWLKLAEMFDSAKPTWKFSGMVEPVAGICDALLVILWDEESISLAQKHAMTDRLGEYFNPNGKDVRCDFFWPNNRRRTSRTLRATACCFLAAMSDPLTPSKRRNGS